MTNALSSLRTFSFFHENVSVVAGRFLLNVSLEFEPYKRVDATWCLNYDNLLIVKVFCRRNVVNKLFEFKTTHMLQLRKRLTYPLIKKKSY